MAHHFRSYTPEQPHLLPPAPQDWLSEDHLAYAVRDVVQQLDLSAFYAGYSADGRGAPPYHPALLVCLLLYAWCNQVYSSRKIARLCRNDLGGRFLAAGHTPDHRCINEFRLRHGKALQALFLQSVRLCQEAGMVSLVHLAVDGTKVAANASKHKAMSYGRMEAEEARLGAEIEQMLQRAAAEDDREDAEFGQEQPGSLFTEEIARRTGRLEKLREAKAALEAQARAAAEAKRAEREAEERERVAAGKRKRGGKKPADPETVKPKEKAQRNFVDPQSRIMKGGDGAWVQGYNGQAAVDADYQVITACDLTEQAADAPHLEAMVSQSAVNTGCQPNTCSADPGYFSAANVTALEAAGIEVLIPPDRQRHGTPVEPAPPLPPQMLASLTVADRMRHQTSTAAGRAGYANRKKTVEPTFGQIKGCPGHPGFRQFLRRGLEKCQQEWHWVCAAHNFGKYMRLARNGQGSAVPG
jgi:transposase